MKTTGIILAAGASRRMGRPKALLEWAGEPFLDRLIGLFTSATRSEPIVVLGRQADVIRAGVRRPFRAAMNPDPERGMLSSLQCGLALLQPGSEGFLFTPVDYPAIEASSVEFILNALERDPDALLAIPRHEGKRGHPVAGRAVVAEELLALTVGAQARDVIHAHRDRTVYVEVDDPGIHSDVDHPEDYDRLLASVLTKVGNK